jgi:hypothetical protein
MQRRKGNTPNGRNKEQKAVRPEHSVEQRQMQFSYFKTQTVRDQIQGAIFGKGMKILFNYKLNISPHVTVTTKEPNYDLGTY